MPLATKKIYFAAHFPSTMHTIFYKSTLKLILACSLYFICPSNPIAGQSCPGLGSLTLNVVSLPVPTLNAPAKICPNSSGNVAVAQTFDSYIWSTGATDRVIPISNPGDFAVTVTNSGGCTGTASIIVLPLEAPSPLVTPLPDTCNGQVSLNVGGGYSAILWSNGNTTNEITVTASNLYTVTVTNIFGCTATTSYAANIIPVPQVSVSGDSSFCFGASVSLSAIPVSVSAYQWSNGQSGASITVTSGGTYTVTATNQYGCSATDSLKVTESGSIQPIINGPSIACDSAQSTLSVTNSFSAYVWNSGANTPDLVVNASGTYTVTVTDAYGCTGTNSFTLAGSPSPNPVISSTPYACNGVISLNAGPSFSSYTWSNSGTDASITADTSGVYSVTVTNAQGCSGTNTYLVNIPALPSVAITGLDSICPGVNTVLNVPSGFSQYSWSDGSGNTNLSVNTGGIYGVTVTDQFGCTATNSFLVGQYPAANPAINGLSQICITGTASFTVPGNFASYSWSTGEITSGIVTNSAGTYTVTVTTANGCIGSDTHTLAVSNTLQPQIQELPYTCNLQISLDAGLGFSTYSWSNGQSTQNISVTNPGTYSVTVGDGSGCTGTATALVNVPSPPLISILGNPQFCTGNANNLSLNLVYNQYAWSTGATSSSITIFAGNTYTVTITDGLGCTATDAITVQETPNPVPTATILPYTCNGQLTIGADPGFNIYNWSGPNGFSEDNQAAVVSSSGNYTVIVTDANGCTGSTSIVASIPVQNTVSLSGPTLFCPGGSVTILASSGFDAYVWSTGSILPSASANAAGVYTVTATDALGCTSTAVSTLDLFPQPAPTINGPTMVCQGDPATLSLGNTFQTYQWSNGAIGSSITEIPPFTASVTVTDLNGCTGTASASVTVSPPPSPTIAELPYNCDNQITIDAGAGFLYVWEGPNGFSSSNQQAITNTSGIYTVTVTNGTGCSGTASIQVSIPTTPNLSIAGFSPICPGQNADLSASAGFVDYLWSNGQSGSNIGVNQPNTYVVTATDSHGCILTSSFTVSPAPPLSPSINGNTLICPGGFSVFNVPGSYAAYSWSNGASTSAINATQSGTYTVTVTDAAGCVGSTSVQLDFAAVPAPSIIQQPYNCSQQITLNAESGYSQYQWSNGSSSQALSIVQAGAYTLTVTNAVGCTGTASIQATIPPNPVAQITGANSFCFGNNTTLIASGSGLVYLWSNGLSGPALNVSESGTYTVTATDAFGCTATETHTVTTNLPVTASTNRVSCRIDDVGSEILTLTAANGCDSILTILTSYEPTKPGLALELPGEIAADLGQVIQINVGANFPIDSVAFQSPFSLSCSNCIDPTMIALAPGFILVEAFDPDGCFASAGIRISVDRKVNIYVPNAFHPGSGENGFFDLFSGPGVQAIRNFHVFDRWGNELFSRENMPTNAPGTGWDGTFRDEAMQPGVYVYYFEVRLVDGSELKYSGDLTLLR